MRVVDFLVRLDQAHFQLQVMAGHRFLRRRQVQDLLALSKTNFALKL
jgi:hypothetical protein